MPKLLTHSTKQAARRPESDTIMDNFEFTETLDQPWLVWLDEAGDYSCNTCAEDFAEMQDWHQQSDTEWTADEGGERTGNEAYEAAYESGECDSPQACTFCGTWLDVKLSKHAWDYMDEHDFPRWLINVYRETAGLPYL